jgi:hypothetical protein
MAERENLRDGSPAAASLERPLADCRDYLTAVPQADESVLASRLRDRATTALLRLRERFAAELKLLGSAVKVPAAHSLGKRIVTSLVVPAFEAAMARAVLEPNRWWPVVVTVPSEGEAEASYEYDLGYVRCDRESDRSGSVRTRWVATPSEWPAELSPPDDFLDLVVGACFDTVPDARKPTDVRGELPDGLDGLDFGGPIFLRGQRTAIDAGDPSDP